VAGRPTRRRSRGKAEREFVAEADEILERMRADLADLADRGADGGEVPPELVNGLFRSAHSLKGLAGLFGLEPIRELAHRMEDLLDGLRLGRIDLAPATVDRIDRAVKLFAELLACVGDAEALTALAAPVTDLAAELGDPRAALREADPLAGLDVERSLLAALTEYEEHRLRENLRRGRHLFLAEASFEMLCFEEGLGELTQGLRELGELISTLPSPGEGSTSQIRFSLLVASDRSLDQVAAALDLPDVTFRPLCAPPPATETRSPTPASGARSEPQASGESCQLSDRRTVLEPARSETQPSGEGKQLPNRRNVLGPESERSDSLRSLGETVRVDIRKLDELMNLVGELAIQREAVAALVSRLASDPATARSASELGRIHKDLDRRLRALQGAVLEVRMVPLRQVFDKVSRVVRRLRAELGKQVRLEVQGADTELDKLIVEALVDPLMHIVRNALDHAIEPSDERLAAGKPLEGLVRIEAFQRGNHVVVAVTDDGRGIDRAALRERAEVLGLVERDQTLGDRELVDLVFVPGVSTRREVTVTSGRGVGMDVVRTNIGLLGGVVDLSSIPGRGTSVSLTLPITLAIIPSLVVEVAGQRFAIPLGAVQETLLVDPSQIQRSEGRELLDLRGAALPLRRLAAELGLRAAPADSKQFAVVLGMGDARLGLLVDRLEGQQDAVIKPIHGPVPSVRGIAGAADLGGSQPVLVLDASALLTEDASRREAA